MTREQFDEKLKACLKDIEPSINKLADKMFNYGAIDVYSYSNDYVLVKIFLTSALSELARQYTPLNLKWKKEAKNLSLFL